MNRPSSWHVCLQTIWHTVVSKCFSLKLCTRWSVKMFSTADDLSKRFPIKLAAATSFSVMVGSHLTLWGAKAMPCLSLVAADCSPVFGGLLSFLRKSPKNAQSEQLLPLFVSGGQALSASVRGKTRRKSFIDSPPQINQEAIFKPNFWPQEPKFRNLMPLAFKTCFFCLFGPNRSKKHFSCFLCL